MVQNAGFQMQLLMRRLRKFQEARPTPELARREFFALHVLKKMCVEKGSGVQMSSLARELDISLPAVSKVVQSLEERGFALREPDPTSRRNTLVRPTERGYRLEQELDQQDAEHTQRIFDRLGEQDTAEFFRICTRLVQIAEEEQQRKEREQADD